jgi:tetratricopeptide (TPR) repeat protein
MLGPDDPDTLTSRNDLAIAYRSSGQVEQAVALHEQVASARERVLGPDHPATLTSRGDLATAYRTAGQAGRAISLHTEVLAARERVLGADHPDTLASVSDLASDYRAAGQVRRAIALHEQVLATRERVLGPDHPETLASRNNLAAALEQKGRLRKALALYRSALAACVRILGEASPETATLRSNVDRAAKARKRQRIRRWLVGATAGLTVVGCLAGATLYSLGVALQEAEEAAARTQVVAPATLAGRAPFTEDPELTRSLAADKQTLLAGDDVASAVVAAYGTPLVDLVYVEAFSLPLAFPEQEMDTLIAAEPRSRLHRVDPGPLGGVAVCGTEVIEVEGVAHEFPACRWVDQASTGYVIWYAQPLAVAEAEFVRMRGEIEVPKAS